MIETDEYSFALPYTTPGEVILWQGKPGKGHLLTKHDFLLIPFSIFCCGIAVYFEVDLLETGAPLLIQFWSIPFLCLGLYMLLGRFIHMALKRKHTAYVITDRKIIRRRGKRIDTLDGSNLPARHAAAFRDGSGTIGFGPRYRHRSYVRRHMHPEPYSFSLENISDVARVQLYIDMMERGISP